MPAVKCGRKNEREASAKALLNRFGLGAKMQRLPRQVSGGQQQRVAIARSLVLEPRYLFADEPNGSLDSVNSSTVMEILTEINAAKGTTIVLVTLEADYAGMAHRQIQLGDGQVGQDTRKFG